MYTIGQFSNLCKITTKALRHYDGLGLLCPRKIIADNQYRLYSHDQIEEALLIKELRDLGMPLKEVATCLSYCREGQSIADMLQKHRVFLLQHLDNLNGRLVRMSLRSERKESMSIFYDIRLKKIDEIPVRSRRQVFTTFPDELPTAIRTVLDEITALGSICSGAPIILYYDQEFIPTSCDVEVAWPVTDPKAVNGKLPAVLAASCLHVGPYDGLPKVYAAMFSWIHEQGYTAVYPTREVSLNDPAVTPASQLVTEIVIPVEVK